MEPKYPALYVRHCIYDLHTSSLGLIVDGKGSSQSVN